MSDTKRRALLMFKIYPPAGTLIMTLHAATLLMGDSLYIGQMLFSAALIPTIKDLLWSRALGFCWIHKAMLYYILMMGSCILFQRLFGFGIALLPMRWFMLLAGLFLLIMMAFKFNDYCYGCK